MPRHVALTNIVLARAIFASLSISPDLGAIFIFLSRLFSTAFSPFTMARIYSLALYFRDGIRAVNWRPSALPKRGQGGKTSEGSFKKV